MVSLLRSAPPVLHKYMIIGDLVHLKVFGQDMVIVNNVDDARELFDKRSAIYSSRPPMPINDM